MEEESAEIEDSALAGEDCLLLAQKAATTHSKMKSYSAKVSVRLFFEVDFIVLAIGICKGSIYHLHFLHMPEMAVL